MHVTNFRDIEEPIIREAADKFGLDIEIIPECYDVYGDLIRDPSMRALYRSVRIDEDAWGKFSNERERLNQEMGLTSQ